MLQSSCFSLPLVPRKPSGLVSSMLSLTEANVFRRYAETIGRLGSGQKFTTAAGQRSFLDKVENALRLALDDQAVTVTLKGGYGKGTQTPTSDMDIVISTPGRKISRDDKKELVEKLKEMPGFHRSHVKLKRLAIMCIFESTEIDLVRSRLHNAMITHSL